MRLMSSIESTYHVAISVSGYKSAFVRANSREEAIQKALNDEIEGEWSDYVDYQCEECEELKDDE